MKRWLKTIVVMCFAVQANLLCAAESVDFATDIISIFTRYGCNAGACHGSAAGRGDFHLSLLGGDPVADYDAVVRQFEGRRVNLANADKSLLLEKPTGDLDHGGDVLFAPDSDAAELLRRWIVDGANRGDGRELMSVEISPTRYVGQSQDDRVKLRVLASFQSLDQTIQRDVTRWTVFTPTDPSAITIDENQVATIHRRGMHVIMVRYLDRTTPISLAVPFFDRETADRDLANRDAEPSQRAVDGGHRIDTHIESLLEQLRLPISAPADDAVWIRRVTLDLAGRLPTVDEAKTFVASPDSNKRRAAVDRLLRSDSFVDYWALRLARLFNLHSLPNETAGTTAFVDWIRQCVSDDIGFDQIAHQLLTATGDSHAIGPANFARMVPDARSHAELVGRVFLGVRIGCANCHNHPLDRWTQDDYHGLAAIFAPLQRGRHVTMAVRGEVTNLRTGQPAIPRIPGYGNLNAISNDHRMQLADWMLSDGKHAFAKATVNRIWQSMFGRGLVDPVDDVRDTNPPSHPELLEHLSQHFIGNRYSLRHTLREIALCESYGRGNATPENSIDDRFYSHRPARPLMPEVFADAIADVTGVANHLNDPEITTRAVSIVDPLTPSQSLDILGRCNRSATCSESEVLSQGLATDLHKINGDLINAKLTSPSGRLHQLIASGATDRQIIDAFYYLAFSRTPSDAERQGWCERVFADDQVTRKQKLEDFVWAILNSRAFSYNH
ncbi:MAG TPA: hypothetical protein DDZ51_12850 [Planctomycetaceae bacterium]|nr:hypothetical protein [Planctomycetaceae bacterium]